MKQKYEVIGGSPTQVGGQMPEEFHKLHLANNLIRTVSIECNQCNKRDYMDDSMLMKESTLEEIAIKEFYDAGWRYCALPDYEVEGIFCAVCIEKDGGVEDNSLQQPYVKETVNES